MFDVVSLRYDVLQWHYNIILKPYIKDFYNKLTAVCIINDFLFFIYVFGSWVLYIKFGLFFFNMRLYAFVENQHFSSNFNYQTDSNCMVHNELALLFLQFNHAANILTAFSKVCHCTDFIVICTYIFSDESNKTNHLNSTYNSQTYF